MVVRLRRLRNWLNAEERRWVLVLTIITLVLVGLIFVTGLASSEWGLAWSSFIPDRAKVGQVGLGGLLLVVAGGLYALARWQKDYALEFVTGGLPIVVYVLLSLAVLTNNNEPEWEVRAKAFAFLSLVFAALAAARLLAVKNQTLGKVFSTATSAAPTVLLLWTFVVVYGVALIAGYQAQNSGADFGCDALPNPNPERLKPERFCVNGEWFDYLVLLGVPGAAAALSKNQQNSQSGTGSGEGTDAVAEVQYFLFKALAMAFVVATLLDPAKHRLPDLPPVLLALTGASALVYTLDKKAPAANGK